MRDLGRPLLWTRPPMAQEAHCRGGRGPSCCTASQRPCRRRRRAETASSRSCRRLKARRIRPRRRPRERPLRFWNSPYSMVRFFFSLPLCELLLLKKKYVDYLQFFFCIFRKQNRKTLTAKNGRILVESQHASTTKLLTILNFMRFEHRFVFC